MALRKPYRNVRVGGGGYTYFRWDFPTVGPILLGFSNQVTITAPQPVAEAVPIQPLNETRPVEIITTAAIGAWTITIQEFEQWNKFAWDELQGIAGSVDLADIFKTVSDQENPINVHKVVKPPIPGGAPYYQSFHGCVVSNARDDEQINVATMQVLKDITIMATHCSVHRGADVVSV